MAQAFLIQKSGGGGVNQTLPEQVTAFHAAANSTPAVVLTWTNPVDHFGGVLIVKKIGTAPTSPTDGEKIYSGTAETFTDADVQFDTEYFYRAFAYNEKKQYQTLYAVASAKPVSGIPLSEMAEGTLIAINRDGVATNHYLGKHDYEPELNGYGRQLMISEECYNQQPFNSISSGASPSIFYFQNTTIGVWLNDLYINKFSDAVQTMIGKTIIPCRMQYYRYYQEDGWLYHSTIYKPELAVFLLSAKELGLSSTIKNSCGTDLALSSQIRNINEVYWCREAFSDSRSYYEGEHSHTGTVDCVNTEGATSIVKNVNTTNGVRPCFTLPATALVNPTPNADGSYTLIEEVA